LKIQDVLTGKCLQAISIKIKTKLVRLLQFKYLPWRNKVTFKVPADGLTYISKIQERCDDLISYGVWEGITSIKLYKWLANFETDEEKYFAACLLDFLIYRSESQTLAMIEQLFTRVIPDLNVKSPMPIPPIDDWISHLNRATLATDPGVRFVAVVQHGDHPGKSGDIIARDFKRKFSINQLLLIDATQVVECHRNGINCFIFIDDFLGTGNQFKEVIIREKIEPILPLIYAAYTPLTAHETGIQAIERDFPSVHISPVETLTATYSVFNDTCHCFIDGENTVEAAKEFYLALLQRKGINQKGANRLGYGGLELAYVFNHAVPDNCLPLFWWYANTDFSPLFDR